MKPFRASPGESTEAPESQGSAHPISWPMLVGLGLFAAYALLILVHTRPPSLTDLGNWTYQGDLLSRHLHGVPDAAHVLKRYPVPNSMITVVIGLLCLFLPWAWASKLFLLLYLALACWAMRSLLRDRRGAELLWIIAPGTLFLNVNFWYGFLNFQVGLCFALLLIASVLRRESREWIYGALLLLAFFSHMIPFAFAAAVLLLYASQSRRYRLLWQLAPATLMAAAYVYGRFVLDRNIDASTSMGSPVRTFSPAFWAYKVSSLLKSAGFVNPGSTVGSAALHGLGKPIFCLMLIADVLMCGSILWLAFCRMRGVFRETPGEAPVWWALVLFLPLYLLCPGEALGVSDPGSRVLQVLLAVALLLAWGRPGVLRFAAVPAAFLAGTGLLLFARDAYQLQPEAGEGSLPRQLVTLGHVPNHDQDAFYDALDRKVMDLGVFPTGLFIDTAQARSVLTLSGRQ